MNPTDEQVKELWEWCGFKQKELPQLKGFAWVSPSGDYWGYRLPSADLKNLFKYAVPLALEELVKQGYAVPFIALCRFWYDQIVRLSEDSSDMKLVALALFWAIWEVLH